MGLRGRDKPELHWFFYCSIARYFHPRTLVSTHEAKAVIGHRRNMPKALRITILEEMEQLGWIEWVTRDVIKLKRPIEVQ